MTILIADSGSTKTQWILQGGKSTGTHFTTGGLNPYFLSKEQLETEIGKLAEELKDTGIGKIFFYGAGCAAPAMAEVVKKAISSHFRGAEVSVETDLLAAARACFNRRSGIACILGTGSNACLYNGEKITDKIPSLGFTLGDEGSGGYFGKILLRDYYYGIMPEEMKAFLQKKHDMNLDSVLEKVYRHPGANAYVASFAGLMSDFPEHPYITELAEKGFREFVLKQLHYFSDSECRNVGFAGSVGAFNRAMLEKVLHSHGYILDIIVPEPIEKLAAYHAGQEKL